MYEVGLFFKLSSYGPAMCLVFISHQTSGGSRLMIGANREEARARPRTSPVCCRQRSLRCLLAGADHGPDGTFPQMGTWLGINERQMAVAVTNRRDGELAWEDQVRSRGLLAVELLGRREPEPAARFAVSELARGGYGGCNFLIANPDAAFVIHAAGARRIALVELEPGIHALTNLDVDDPDDPRIRFVQSTLNPLDFISSASRICRDQRVVITGADRGTVSSSLIVAGEEIVLYHTADMTGGGQYQGFRLTDTP
jgi:uncharacterized protein with NRDE domain